MHKIKLSYIKNTVNIFDFIGTIIGLILLAIGIYKIYPPAMYIVIGIILAFPRIPRRAVK
jgi:hypothetical protein